VVLQCLEPFRLSYSCVFCEIKLYETNLFTEMAMMQRRTNVSMQTE
jgi:hypothetical protein